MFVTVEGAEGAGKTTLVRRLAAKLLAAGDMVLTVREPGGTPVAESARRLVLSPKYEITPPAELFLMLVARADLVTRVIRPALEVGKIVIADRFELSTFAYQVHGRGLPEDTVRSANELATGGLKPDLTIVLDVSPEVSRERQETRARGLDRLEREGPGFYDRVAAAFRNADGPHIVHIDGASPLTQVVAAAWEVFQSHRRGATA